MVGSDPYLCLKDPNTVLNRVFFVLRTWNPSLFCRTVWPYHLLNSLLPGEPFLSFLPSVAEPELVKSRNRNRNLSKVGTGSLKLVMVPQHCFCHCCVSQKKEKKLPFLWSECFSRSLKARNKWRSEKKCISRRIFHFYMILYVYRTTKETLIFIWKEARSCLGHDPFIKYGKSKCFSLYLGKHKRRYNVRGIWVVDSYADVFWVTCSVADPG